MLLIYNTRGLKFCTEYAQLKGLREHLPGVPFAACTATATPDKHQQICIGLGFDERKALCILERINRPNLFFAVWVIEGAGYGDINLNFLIPPNLNLSLVQWILKTLIYIDNKKHAPKLATVLGSLLTPEFRVRPPRPDV